MVPPPDLVDAPTGGGTQVLSGRRPDEPGWQIPAGHAGRYRQRRRPAPATDNTATPMPAGETQQLRLARGTELLGRSEGSGYLEEHHLARTGTGRVVQLTDLLFLVAQAAGKDGRSDTEVAAAVTEQYGKQVTADNVRTLADKLRPLGILAAADGSDPEVTEPDPLLALRLRTTLLGPAGVKRLTAPLRALFFLPIVGVALVGLIAMDLWLFLAHGLAAGVRESMAQPSLFLLAFGLVVVSAAFHECGHATACAVGGGKPGRMGAGIYLAWPAFYTDVTDAYRLNRTSRLRTDLGGVYFSCLLVLALGGTYALTRFEPLLLIAFLMQIEVVHQMLPFLRLDGYYVVSDLVGVPDLFRRTGPVLKSMVPGHRPEPSVLELKPWVRTVVRVWVLVVVPILLFNIGMILLNFPQLVSTAWNNAATLIGGLSHAGITTVLINIIQLVFLALPIVGLGYTFAKLFSQLGRKGWTASQGSPAKRAGFLAAAALVVGGLALAWYPDARYTPYREGERGTLGQQASALSYVGQGRPLLRSPSEAQQPLPPLPAGLARAYSRPGRPVGTTQTSPQGGTLTRPGQVAPSSSAGPTPTLSGTSTGPAGSEPSASAATSPSPSPSPSTAPSDNPTVPASPSASPSPTATASASPTATP